MSNFMKIRLLGAELFRADRRTDMTTQIVAFRNFSNAPKTVVMLTGSAPQIRSGYPQNTDQPCHRSGSRRCALMLSHNLI